MLSYVLRRSLATAPVMLVSAILVFLLLRVTPGDPAAIIAGDMATQEQLAAIRQALGLDLPIPVQFARWISDILRGDLGTSIVSGVPVLQLIASHLSPTISLAVATLALSIIVAVPLGACAASWRGSPMDRVIMAVSSLGFSVPVFVLGYALVYVLAIKLKILPVQGYQPLSQGWSPFLAHLVMPTIALSFGYIALIARITRASVIETLCEDYVRTARAKGVKESTVVVRHALRNAAVPIVTVIGSGLALLLGGVVVTESVFNIPGLGRLAVDAVLARDYPVIQGMILFSSMLYVVINLCVDLSYTLFDPRIRY